MKKCSHCGNTSNNGSRFCKSCGADIANEPVIEDNISINAAADYNNATDSVFKRASIDRRLKTHSIILIIFGAIKTLFEITEFRTIFSSESDFVSRGYSLDTLYNIMGVSRSFTYSVVVIAFIFQLAKLIAGIIGIKTVNKPENIKMCIMFGVICVILSILHIVTYSIYVTSVSPEIMEYNSAADIFSVCLSIIVPGFYLNSAIKSR